MGSSEHDTQQGDTTTEPEATKLPEPQEAPSRQDADTGYHAEAAVQGDPRDFAQQLPHCGLCRIGLLYPITFDPEATHEANQGQAAKHEQYAQSGGSMLVRCFNCGGQQSQPLGIGEGA